VEPALRQIHQLLKTGGTLSFAEPNYLNPQIFLERKLRFLPFFSYTSPDETAFVRWSLRRRLERAGFGEISITPFDWLHPSTPPKWIDMVQAIGRAMERIPIIREFSGSVYIRACRLR
jgi:hypothetical protein